MVLIIVIFSKFHYNTLLKINILVNNVSHGIFILNSFQNFLLYIFNLIRFKFEYNRCFHIAKVANRNIINVKKIWIIINRNSLKYGSLFIYKHKFSTKNAHHYNFEQWHEVHPKHNRTQKPQSDRSYENN